MNALAVQTNNSMQALVPRSVPEAMELSKMFASSSLIPDHLKNKPGDCMLVVMQAQRWGMDALSVAQCTSVVRGKLCYEGKLVAAVLYSMGAIDGRLRYDFKGDGETRSVTVSGRPRGMTEEQSVEGSVRDWKTDNGNWKKAPDDMLVYRGTRQWARRYAPEALLGVYTPDEIEGGDEPQGKVYQGEREVTSLPAYSGDLFEANLAKWKDAIAKGKKTAEELIAMVESKGALTDAQKTTIRNLAKSNVIEGELVTEGEAA